MLKTHITNIKHFIGYYSRRFYLWKNRKQFPQWWARLHCNTCGKNVFRGRGDFFMLKHEIWKKATDTPFTSERMVLCKKCTERLLGRKLTKDDYAVPETFEEKEQQWQNIKHFQFWRS